MANHSKSIKKSGKPQGRTVSENCFNLLKDLNPFGPFCRINRLKFLALTFCAWGIMLVVVGINMVLGFNRESFIIAGIWFILFALKRSAGRFHDFNWNSLNVLWLLIPVINIPFSLMLLFRRGNRGENRFGPEPEALNVVEKFIFLLPFVEFFIFWKLGAFKIFWQLGGFK